MEISTDYALQNHACQAAIVNERGDVVCWETKSNLLVQELIDPVILELVSIPGGTLLMGSPTEEMGRYTSEGPQHKVTVFPFLMGQYPVTQAQWRTVAALPKVKITLPLDPSHFKGDQRPVEQVNWYQAVEFCQRLSRYSGRRYRLPSEAEWEYACRAGTTTPFHLGPTLTPDLANYDGRYTYDLGPAGDYRQQTTTVGTFSPNAFGLYDMHGNVWEWCGDVWHTDYRQTPATAKAWMGHGRVQRRVLRGGSWLSQPSHCRSACRVDYFPEYGLDYHGFRVVRDHL